MVFVRNSVLCLIISFVLHANSSTLCESGFCRTYEHETGCNVPNPECDNDNATSSLWLPSPTTCNCCEYCLPLYDEGSPCSVGGPGLGVTVGRCGFGLTCVPESDGPVCRRMPSLCHDAQDKFDERHESGEAWSMEMRPVCDGKAKFETFHCVPAHTCFCQSEDGERLFGEVLYQGAATSMNMHCGCSRQVDKINKVVGPAVAYPIAGPRCTADGSFSPVQCMNRTCHCVNRVTGAVIGNHTVDLDVHNITRLPCYDRAFDLFPEQSEGESNFNFTTQCLEEMRQKKQYLQQSEREGFIVDFFNTVSDCLPDGTYGRIVKTRNESKICVDERGVQIEDFEAFPGTPQYDDNTMDCKCAQTRLIMSSSSERPVCCSNGNFRRIQCRRGLCRCVDADGRQDSPESSDVNSLHCYTQDWRDC